MNFSLKLKWATLFGNVPCPECIKRHLTDRGVYFEESEERYRAY